MKKICHICHAMQKEMAEGFHNYYNCRPWSNSTRLFQKLSFSKSTKVLKEWTRRHGLPQPASHASAGSGTSHAARKRGRGDKQEPQARGLHLQEHSRSSARRRTPPSMLTCTKWLTKARTMCLHKCELRRLEASELATR